MIAWYKTRKAKLSTDITAYWLLAKMCFGATKLWNMAVWHSRMEWENSGKIPSGFDLQKELQETYWYKMLPAFSSQNAAHRVGMAYKSWYKLRKTDKTARPPGFRKKEVLSSFVLKKAYFRIDGNTLRASISKKLHEEMGYPNQFLFLDFSLDKPIVGEPQTVEIIPMDGYFMAHIRCKLPEPEWKEVGQVKAIDLGICNLAATVNEDGSTKIFNGGGLLAEQRYFNKRIASLQEKVVVKSKGNRSWSKRLSQLSRKKTNRVRHIVHSASKTIINDCINEGVNVVVVGDLKGIKKNKDGSGKKWNDESSQKLQQSPMRLLVSQLRYKLAAEGIRLIEIDERGTSSKRDSVCGSGNVVRSKRGLFHCKDCGIYLNADVNGARNILQRYLQSTSKEARSSGCLAHPLASRWDGHLWTVAG